MYKTGQEYYLSYLSSYACGQKIELSLMKRIHLDQETLRVDWREDMILSHDEGYLIYRKATSNRDISILDIRSGKELIDEDFQQ